MSLVKNLMDKVMSGDVIGKSEALALYGAPLNTLCAAANNIRKWFCSDEFDICTIVNGKSGRCSEDCKFCAQSSHYKAKVQEYPLMDTKDFIEDAQHNKNQGIVRYSIVTSGKKLSDEEVEKICKTIREIREKVDILICVSFGLLDVEQYKKIKAAGASRVHNNLETSRANFHNICTTHSFQDKVDAIKAAQEAGLTVCSGGIMGLGETVVDRIDMALSLRELGIKSIPINILNSIKGTPFEKKIKLEVEDVRRIVAIYRFIMPDAFIRLAGGRGLLEDKGESCFESGANATISGDMLTTAGISVKEDLKLIEKLGYKVVEANE